jgi:predicted flap endonuclease-1-like 5' DNA nuclease
MQEFFTDYGLWLLLALLVVIGLIVLLSGSSRKTGAVPSEEPLPVDDITAPTIMVAPEAAALVGVTTPAPLVDPASTQAPAIEPVAVEQAPSPVVPDPEPETPPIPVSPAVTSVPQADDLLQLKGVGPKLNSLLIELGVTSFAQIAGWTDTDIAAIDARLGNFRGRPVRDQWIDQAKYLASGDIAGFEAKYGKL